MSFYFLAQYDNFFIWMLQRENSDVIVVIKRNTDLRQRHQYDAVVWR